MDKQNLALILNEFKSFENKKIKNIKSSSITMKSEDCFLIEESWFRELVNIYRNFNNTLSNNNFSFNENEPIFINNFLSLTNGQKFKIINKNLIQLIYNEKFSNNNNTVIFYAGNNKIIIEYKDKKDTIALLLLKRIINDQKINELFFIITNNQDKSSLYEKILNENDIDKYNNKYIFSREYINICKLFIYFYYFEKSFCGNINIFKKNEYYYLVNPKLINEFKEYYNYPKISQFLEFKTLKDININYNNIDNYIDNIIQLCLIENILNIKKDESFKDLNYFGIMHKGYIIDSKIYELFKKSLNKEINIKPKKLFINNNIFLVEEQYIYIGNIDKEILFNIKYIICYNSLQILESEKKLLLNPNIPFEQYLNNRNCQINDSNTQILHSKHNGEIGKIKIFVQNHKKAFSNQKNINISKKLHFEQVREGINKQNLTKLFLSKNEIIKSNNNLNKQNIIQIKKENENERYNLFNNNNTNREKIINPFQINFSNNKNNQSDSNNINNINNINNSKNINNSNNVNNPNNINSYNSNNLNQINNIVINDNYDENKNEPQNKENELNYLKKLKYYEEEINKLKNINKEKDNEIFQLKNNNKNIIKENENLLNEVFKKNDELNKNKININNELQLKNIELNSINQKLKNSELLLNENNSKIILMEKDYENKEKEINNKYNNLLKEKENKIKILKDNYESVKNELNTISYKYQKLLNESKLNNNNNEDKQITKLFSEKYEYENLLKEKDSKINELNNIYSNNKIEINNLKNQLEEYTNIKNENNLIKTQLNSTQQQNKILIQEIENNKNNMIEYINCNKFFLAILGNSLKMNKEYEIKINQLTNRIQNLENTNIELNNKLQNKLINNSSNEKEIRLITENKETSKINNPETVNNNKINDKILEVDPLKSYSKPTLIGLDNIGSINFMNATLQCLSQTKGLTNYFLKNSNENEIINNNIAIEDYNNAQLSPNYLYIIKKLWEKDANFRSFFPYNITNAIQNLNPIFEKFQPGDCKDFIIFILEQLHKELKKPINNSNKVIQLDKYNKKSAFKYAFNKFTKECSIISDIFFGFKETTNECINCKNYYNSKGLNNPICYNYSTFNCLFFSLERIKKDKEKNNNLDDNITLEDCFLYNQKSEIFTGENKIFCNMCKQLTDALHTSKIFISPNILVLIFDRNKNNIFNIKVKFSETLDISNFVSKKVTPKIIYNLYGIISYIKETDDNPYVHFVAFCKSPIDKKWYLYDDSSVSNINNINDYIDFGIPYIEFYEKCN